LNPSLFLQWRNFMEKQAVDTAASSRPHPTAHTEVELKLLASLEAIERIRADPVMARHARNRGVVRRLDTVYYDTPDRALFRHRSSLRVRRNGTRYVQSLKLACINGSPFVRQQWEARVNTPAPDPARLPADITCVLGELAEDGLAPVFVTRLRRHLQRLAFDGAEIEIAFDEGTVEAGEHGQALVEIELKLKCGDIGALYDVGMQLLDVAPLRLGTLSKAERGYALAFDAVPQVTKAERSAISAKHCVDDVITEVMSAAQQHSRPGVRPRSRGRAPDTGGVAPPAFSLFAVAEGSAFAGIPGIRCRGEMAYASAGVCARLGRVRHGDTCASGGGLRLRCELRRPAASGGAAPRLELRQAA
jgi:CYTH domain